MDELTARIQQAAESILENEALTDNLDDTGGQALLDWGVALAKPVAQATDGLDEAAAETAMDDKLAAIRRLLRAVNKRFDPTLVADLKTNDQATAEANTKLLDQVVEQAAIMLAPNFTPPTGEQLASFAEQTLSPLDTAPALIAALRSFIDQKTVSAPIAEPTSQALPVDQATPTTAPAIDPPTDPPTPAQTVATETVTSIPPQPPITADKSAASLVPSEENSKAEPILSQPGSSWAARMFSNFRRFLKNAQNQS